MYTGINLMLPTYGRGRTSLPKFLDSALETADDPGRLCFTFCIKTTDRDALSCIMSRMSDKKYVTVTETTEQPSLAKYFNQMYKMTDFYGDSILVSMLGDDMVFKTKGWDTRVLNEINSRDGIALVHCEDNFSQHGKIPVNFFTTRKVVELTGHPFMCEQYYVDNMDLVWKYVSEDLGINVFLKDVVISHEHAFKTGNKDNTFERMEKIRHTSTGDARKQTRKIADRIINKYLENLKK